jgi:hypothetical protein
MVAVRREGDTVKIARDNESGMLQFEIGSESPGFVSSGVNVKRIFVALERAP